MGSSDWLRVYPFEEHVLLLHGAWCQQPAVQLHHPFSDEWRPRWGCELTVTGNSVWRRWTAGPDKHSIAVSKEHSSQQQWQWPAIDCETQRGRAGVLWASRSDSTANVQHSWSWGVLSSGPAAGGRINQRQVAGVGVWDTSDIGTKTFCPNSCHAVLPPSKKECNYVLRASKSSLRLTKFLANTIHIYGSKIIYYKNTFHN
jgi:hypothetical protein